MNKYFLELFIAWRYLIHRSGEGFISLISIFSFMGIMLGVATLIIVMSVMNGFHEKLIDNIIGISGHINITSNKDAINNYKKIITELSGESKIVKIIPMIQGQGLATIKDSNTGVFVLGLESLEDKKSILKDIKINPEFNKEKKILIGARLAEIMNLKIGDHLKLISSKSASSIIGEIPRAKSFEIGDIFESGIYDFDISTVIMPLNQAQVFFQVYNSVNKIEVYLTSPLLSQQFTDYIKQKLDLENNSLIINDWHELNSHYLNALETEKSVMFLILSLIILIAMFNVISSLVMMVTEKQKSVAILRSFGMSKVSITRIFIHCGMIISTSGTVLGITMGLIFSFNINTIKKFIEHFFGVTLFDKSIYLFNEMPTSINYHDLVYIVCFSLILSLLAVIYPSRKAARLDPASILRYL